MLGKVEVADVLVFVQVDDIAHAHAARCLAAKLHRYSYAYTTIVTPLYYDCLEMFQFYSGVGVNPEKAQDSNLIAETL